MPDLSRRWRSGPRPQGRNGLWYPHPHRSESSGSRGESAQIRLEVAQVRIKVAQVQQMQAARGVHLKTAQVVQVRVGLARIRVEVAQVRVKRGCLKF